MASGVAVGGGTVGTIVGGVVGGAAVVAVVEGADGVHATTLIRAPRTMTRCLISYPSLDDGDWTCVYSSHDREK